MGLGRESLELRENRIEVRTPQCLGLIPFVCEVSQLRKKLRVEDRCGQVVRDGGESEGPEVGQSACRRGIPKTANEVEVGEICEAWRSIRRGKQAHV